VVPVGAHGAVTVTVASARTAALVKWTAIKKADARLILSFKRHPFSKPVTDTKMNLVLIFTIVLAYPEFANMRYLTWIRMETPVAGRTQSARLFVNATSFCLALSLLSLPVAAWASPLGDARKEVAIQKNKYFDTVYANPTMSSADMAKLYNQLVVPSENKIASAFSQTVHDQWIQVKESIEKQNQEAQEMIKKRAKGSGEKAPAGALGRKASPSAPDTSPSKPEVVLDGSGIAKEIEFKGKPKKVAAGKKGTPAAAATPVAPPTVIEYKKSVASPGGGVDEVEFGTKPAPVPTAKR
jgi:hypothetical protein